MCCRVQYITLLLHYYTFLFWARDKITHLPSVSLAREEVLRTPVRSCPFYGNSFLSPPFFVAIIYKSAIVIMFFFSTQPCGAVCGWFYYYYYYYAVLLLLFCLSFMLLYNCVFVSWSSQFGSLLYKCCCYVVLLYTGTSNIIFVIYYLLFIEPLNGF